MDALTRLKNAVYPLWVFTSHMQDATTVRIVDSNQPDFRQGEIVKVTVDGEDSEERAWNMAFEKYLKVGYREW